MRRRMYRYGGGGGSRVAVMSWPTVTGGAFEWWASDGVTPTTGPSPLVETGTPIYDSESLWSGTPAMLLDGSQRLFNATAVDPSAGEDCILTVVAQSPVAASGDQNVLVTEGTAGFRIYYNCDLNRWSLDCNGDSNTYTIADCPADTWGVITWRVDRDGNITAHVNGRGTPESDVDACPTGDLGSGAGVCLGAVSNGANPYAGKIVGVQVAYGVNLADWTDAKIAVFQTAIIGGAPLS